MELQDGSTCRWIPWYLPGSPHAVPRTKDRGCASCYYYTQRHFLQAESGTRVRLSPLLAFALLPRPSLDAYRVRRVVDVYYYRRIAPPSLFASMLVPREQAMLEDEVQVCVHFTLMFPPFLD